MAPAEQLRRQHHDLSALSGSEPINEAPRIASNSARLRILHVIESCGGSGRHVLDLAKGQILAAHDVTVIYSPNRAEESFLEELLSVKGLRTWPMPMKRAVCLHDAVSLRVLTGLVRQSGPYDILHGHSSKAGALIRLLPPWVSGARIYTPHAFRTMDPSLSQSKRVVFAGLEKILAGVVRGPILTGSEQETEAGIDIGIRPAQLRRIPFAIDPGPLPTRQTARSGLNLADDVPVIGFVGRLATQKAPERVVEALAKMQTTSTRLVMVGGGPLTQDALIASAAKMGVADRILFTGPLRGVDVMPAFDLFVIPSRYESLGYIFLEGLAAGIPMVATDVGIAKDVIQTEENGLIVENTDDPSVWATALDDALTPSKLKQLTAGAIKRKKTTALSDMVNAVEIIYRECLSQ